MKFNISYPLQGTQKSFEIDDDNKCRIFFERRLGQQVEADLLGDDFKGYVFKIAGGNDKDGFPMKQGVFSNGRVRLLLSTGTSCYRPRRTGERRRKSVRGCIVGPDIRALSLVLVKKGDKEIPGLTDVTKSRRLGPKRVSGIRKLYGLEKGDGVAALIKKNIIRRTFTSKKNANAPARQKAPKIQRLVTEARLRRKKLIKKEKVDRWNTTKKATQEYQKLYNEWSEKKRRELRAKTHPVVKTQQKKVPATTQKKPVDDKKAATKPKVVATKPVVTKEAPKVVQKKADVKPTVTKAKKATVTKK